MANKTLKKYRGYEGSIEADFDNDILCGKILFISDFVGYEGESLSELKQEFEAAVDAYIEVCEAAQEKPNLPFSGTFNVRVGPEIHEQLVRRAYQLDVKMNRIVKEAIVSHLSKENVTNVHHNTYTLHFESQEALEDASTTGIDRFLDVQGQLNPSMTGGNFKVGY